MTKRIFATVLAAALGLGTGLGCSSMRPNDKATTIQPNAVTGAAGTTSTGIDSTANPTPGTSSGVPPGKAANPDEPPGIESGTDRDTPPEQLEGQPPMPQENTPQEAPESTTPR